jgi:DNA-binding MarR family transcriptional regulator
MQQDTTQAWRSLLQLAQATYAVLEREIPENEGLPANGLAVLRLLRWHGGKTLSAIAAFVGVTTATMDETMREMVRLGFVRRGPETSSEDSPVFELDALGVDVSRRVVVAQRKRIERSLARLPEGQQEAAAAILETLAFDLVADSPGFSITCAECWALDVRECVKSASAEHCAFRLAQRADLDPDLSDGPSDTPAPCSGCSPRYVALGTDS